MLELASQLSLRIGCIRHQPLATIIASKALTLLTPLAVAKVRIEIFAEKDSNIHR
jgi:hypothetical protein